MCSVLKFAPYSWESMFTHTPTGPTTTTNEILTGNQITRTQTKPAQITVATTTTTGYSMYKGSGSSPVVQSTIYTLPNTSPSKQSAIEVQRVEINAPKKYNSCQVISAPLSALSGILLTVYCWENWHTHSLCHRRIDSLSESPSFTERGTWPGKGIRPHYHLTTSKASEM